MRKSRSNKKQAGGGLGAGWGFQPSTQDQIISNPIVATPIGNCREVAPSMRPGFLVGGVTPRGLPGMSGGKRKNRKSKKVNRKASRKSKKATRKASRKYNQLGGRYGFDADIASVIGGTPSTSGYAPISSIPCEASRQTIPDSGAANNLNSRASYLWSGPNPGQGQMGGAVTGAPLEAAYSLQTPSNQVPITWPNHGAASGSPSEMVPTSRYSVNSEPPITTSAGTNVSINTPINYPQMNPACLKTGGGKKSKKSRRHQSKKAIRKSNKKNKK
jgi:hypothetical protein